jgi:hypothetical protein
VANELDDRWYFNVDKGVAEKGPAKRGFREARLGPYETKEQAERGLAELHERNKRMDEEDRRWNEGS